TDKVVAGTGNSAISFYYLSGTTLTEGTGSDAKGAVTLYATYGNGGNGDTGPGEMYKIQDSDGYGAPIGTTGSHSDTLTRVAHVGSPSNQVYRGVASFGVIDLTGSGSTISSGTFTEGSSAVNVQVATFTDPDDTSSAEAASNFTATISWGDGSSSVGTIT